MLARPRPSSQVRPWVRVDTRCDMKCHASNLKLKRNPVACEHTTTADIAVWDASYVMRFRISGCGQTAAGGDHERA